MTEPGAGSDVNGILTTAVKKGKEVIFLIWDRSLASNPGLPRSFFRSRGRPGLERNRS